MQGLAKRSFSAGEVAKHSGVNYKTLHYWSKTGFLEPSIAEASGTGSRREYSFGDLVAARVAFRLRRAGVSLQGLRRVVSHLRGLGVDRPLTSSYLVADVTGEVFMVDGDAAVATLRAPGQQSFLFVVDVGGVVEELRRALAA
jgi:DNA-binding transcriptional MerR regulator